MTDAEEDKVRLDHEGRDVWLVRVPPSVARAWDKVDEEDAQLGKLRIYHAQEGDERPRITFHMAQEAVPINQALQITSDFNLQFIDGKPNMRIFSKGDAGVDFQGLVEHSFLMQPLRSEAYNEVVHKRVRQQTSKSRHTKEIDGWEIMRKQKKNRIVRMEDPANRNLETGEGGAAKRRKLDASEETKLRERIFELFSRKDTDGRRLTHWTLKDMKRELGFGDAAVRNVLRDICIYHRDGDYARTYELKAEFKSSIPL
ncbi:General transcription factor IIF subunit 2 [Hondaea fermentalgiana]|uniref:General transcription factor IIF subunit 2 n=1 Tax=Hondaea fermentalgiana TaxID=2315210 RepID=A0A2R5GC14_9STRA|nr:General transcription factor IIF subunit 2 [Hondaea fermentalgiana]|eukprot:GBG28530.1 General transcription factor IIF subunit 2 [Hondaea fermentalgiana]